jgi:hypothetical protein
MAEQADTRALKAEALNAQLTPLPTFSDNMKEERLTAKEWPEKVILHKNGSNWTKIKPLKHFQNSLRGKM